MEKMPQKASGIIMRVMEKMTPSCDVISQKISRSMDEKISLKDRLQIKVHILGCILCERYRDQLLTIRRAMEKYLNNIEEELLDQITGLSKEAANRIKLAVRQQKGK